MKKSKIGFLVCILVVLFSCKENGEKKETKVATPKVAAENFPDKELALAAKQYDLLLKDAREADRVPRTVNKQGGIHWANQGFDWTIGFFPGTCWYLFEDTNDEKWKDAADYFQSKFENFKNIKSNHDLGFVFQCSYGNGYKNTKNESYKDVLITAANSLIERFNPKVGSIKSWNVDGGWQSERGWKFPVIIDNMMNLELLFEVSKMTGDEKYKQIAITHANTTLKNHFRDNNSSYHVIDYAPKTGKVRSKQTAQGFNHESSWARGQAWGLYGFTLSYRYTKDEAYLEQATKIADFILSNESTPEDMIPYWDYDAPNIPNEPRDVSAAAITASALIELAGYDDEKYMEAANKILKSLASSEYTANIGENNHFILKHSVGSIPHKNEINVPLNYADYYYVEALLRYREASGK
ncbi:glycoside hydrolase family 88 protein [Salegentibacter maritimus]|uniref:glycoside hydrolase family 88 protein n=1 Tax=Salegentibacter maritimus TaxID=2794347 RepID=UPI0018E40947|nr:glycoside hydrolase family 88 protein [Salegentibacter maritimus]MBI6115911.1 glycoside hydrolase family 88 protein [Salegentibacter maritimus]